MSNQINPNSVQIPANTKVLDVKDSPDMSYEFELKVRLPDWIASMRPKKAQKGKWPENMAELPPAIKKFAEATSVLPGHTFFVLRAKEKGKTVAESEIGFTFARDYNAEKIEKQKGPGVAGYLQDQSYKDPRYDFSRKFEISRDQFDNAVNYVKETVKNPPNYTWPIAYNCVKYAKKAAKAAGLKEAPLMGVTNLPMGTVAYIKVKQVTDEINKAAKRIESAFSPERKAPQKKKSSEAIINRKISKDR